MARNARTNWSMPEIGGIGHNVDHAQLATLMDIRDTLDSIDTSLKALRCINFLRIPAKLDAIRRNTTKRKYTKKSHA